MLKYGNLFIVLFMIFIACNKEQQNSIEQTEPVQVVRLPSGKEIKSTQMDFKYEIKDLVKIYQGPGEKFGYQETKCNKISILEKSRNKQYWFYVTNDAYVTGWINILSLEKQLEREYYKDIIEFKNINEINNSYQAAKYQEYRSAHKEFRIRRIGPLLIIKKENQQIYFMDSLDEFGSCYNIVDIMYNKYPIIHVQYYEGGVYTIWNFENDKKMDEMYSLPVFSPDHSSFITCGSSYEEPDSVRIFRKENYTIRKECNVSVNLGKEDYYLKSLGWVDNFTALVHYKKKEGNEIELKFEYNEKKNKWNISPAEYVTSNR
jgi:hypothetical protein